MQDAYPVIGCRPRKTLSENPLRIVQVITRADLIGGAQIHVLLLCRALLERGHEVRVIVGGHGPFLGRLEALSIPYTCVGTMRRPINAIHDLRAVRDVRRAVAACRPDVVATHSSKAGIVGRVAARSLGIPTTFTAHGWSFTPGVPAHKAWLFRRVERLAAPLASRIITVSEYDRKLALYHRIAPPEKVVAIHNGLSDVDLPLASPERCDPRIVMAARFEPQKAQPILLEALSGLAELPWELDLIGDGPLLKACRSLAAKYGLAKRVRFLGWRDDVAERLAESHIFVLASHFEGLPLSILEAMRAGLPVVASDVGGVSELVAEGETGLLVGRETSTEVMRNTLDLLLRDPNLRARLGRRGRRRYEERFTLDRSVSKTLQVYAEVAGE